VARVLVIEDEALVGELIVMNLERAGHAVRLCTTIAAGTEAIATEEPELLVVDAMLPDGTGFELIAKLRAAGKRFSVLMLTSLADSASKVRGLDAGADDYLPKPFDVHELLARVRALLRRAESTRDRLDAEKTAVLLLNVGSPKSPQVADVRAYLAEFLSDPRVIDIHPVARWLLLHGVILRTRPKKSAALYRTIWTEQGSPLLVYSQALQEALQRKMPDVTVAYAMRYGEPAIPRVVDALMEQGIDRLLVVPLYPQYSLSATKSAVEAVERALRKHPRARGPQILDAFYADRGFIAAYAANLSAALAEFAPDHVLFSYHGLPKHQVAATCARAACNGTEACGAVAAENKDCYRAQAFATTRLIAEAVALRLPHETAFQSRLRGKPWIEPFSDARIEALAQSGRKRLLVVCPSFVTDCLETLDEVGNRFRAQWLAAGGEDLRLVPALNAAPPWIDALERLCRAALAAKAEGKAA
jgi:ferrochelatase